MASKQKITTTRSAAEPIESALEAMQAHELRTLIVEVFSYCDEATRTRLTNDLINKAARNASGWRPKGPTIATMTKIETFAQAATRRGSAEPAQVDAYLSEGSNAYLAKEYQTALRIFRALLVPLSDCSIDLGQEEELNEVLGVDPMEHAAKYFVAIYMTTPPMKRGKAVLAAMEEVQNLGYFCEPLQQLEEIALEPLPDFGDFLKQWQALVEAYAANKSQTSHRFDIDRWRREVIERTQGAEGLGILARSSKRVDVLQAWCHALIKSCKWHDALAANIEAADRMVDNAFARGRFLDGAAFAAEQLESDELTTYLQRAWNEAPTMLRLLRWLGSSKTKTILRKRVVEALQKLPAQHGRQRALLLVLNGDFAPAAKLLASAPGLGWSHNEHPGHLLFALFAHLYGTATLPDMSEYDDGLGQPNGTQGPQLTTPSIEDVFALAGTVASSAATVRSEIFDALRVAAENRIKGLIENKRRRHYEHAASLVATCLSIDKSTKCRQWLASLRSKYSRYSALQNVFDEMLGHES